MLPPVPSHIIYFPLMWIHFPIRSPNYIIVHALPLSFWFLLFQVTAESKINLATRKKKCSIICFNLYRTHVLKYKITRIYKFHNTSKRVIDVDRLNAVISTGDKCTSTTQHHRYSRSLRDLNEMLKPNQILEYSRKACM